MLSAVQPSPHHRRTITTDRHRSDAIRPNRILIDCTPTFRHDCGTGVQRVVRNLVNWSAAAGGELNVLSHGVMYDAGGFRMVPSLPEVRIAPPGAEDRVSVKKVVKQAIIAAGLLGPAHGFGEL